MEGNREKEHLLALKVMRLTKPSLMHTHPVLCEERDLPGKTLSDCHQRDLASVKALPNFALGELLTLPQNFGNIFLGETFSSYISVHNDSNQVCRDILVKADLQTSSQRLVLSGANAQPVAELPPEANIDDVIHHEVKELGTHILVCAVSYMTSTGEKRYFRKFFKFQVLKPLDVRTNFYNTENEKERGLDILQSDEVYMEAQIQNITPGPIYVERISLDPSPQYLVRQFNADKDNEKSVFGVVNYMNPLDVRQYLYCLQPKKEMYEDPKQLRCVTNIGKLDIVWKTNMGEKGRLQTSPLHRVAPGYGDIRLTVETLPDAVKVENTFNVAMKVTNCCERTMDLVLVLENKYLSAGLLWCGISGKQLGKLKPNTCLNLDLSLLASKPGLQTISGLRLTDTFLKRTYEHDGIAQVFVYGEDLE